MKARIINQQYTAASDMRVLAKLPYLMEKPWLVRVGWKSERLRTHAAAIRWAQKQFRKGKA
jgi:hypothetical protein